MRILLLFHIPSESTKRDLWHDGFVAAVHELETRHEVTWHNVALDPEDDEALRARLGAYDVVLVKSAFGWVVDRYARLLCAGKKIPRALMISGSAAPDADGMRFYDVLFHETEHYLPRIARHAHAVHAFGVDTRVMHPRPRRDPPQFDVLGVGRIVAGKRHVVLAGMEGRRAVVGDQSAADPGIREQLESSGVELIDFVSYAELSELYRNAALVIVNDVVQGGGERAVLEARACGTPVRVAEDNPKLRQLLEQPEIWDHVYYAQQLEAGLSTAARMPGRSIARRVSELAREHPRLQQMNARVGRSRARGQG